MAIGFQAFQSGQVCGDANRVDGLIRAGISRLAQFQQQDGMFAIWCGGEPARDITSRVAHRLIAVRQLPYEQAHRMLESAAGALLRLKHRDNQLLALDEQFRDKMKTVKDAVALYFDGDGQRDAALDFLRRKAKRNGQSVHWAGKPEWGYWGGELEATCDASRVMLDAGDPLFRAGFNYVGSRMINGMLYSTADTRALIELLATIKTQSGGEAIVDGRRVPLDESIVAEEVEAVAGRLIVRVDEQLEIDWLEPRRDFRFELSVRPKQLQLGQRARVTIKLKEQSICPLARVYLPGCLALLQGGANAQTAHLPIGAVGLWMDTRGQLELDAVAVRRGRGGLQVAVHDLYDARKIGTAAPVVVTVR